MATVCREVVTTLLNCQSRRPAPAVSSLTNFSSVILPGVRDDAGFEGAVGEVGQRCTLGLTVDEFNLFGQRPVLVPPAKQAVQLAVKDAGLRAFDAAGIPLRPHAVGNAVLEQLGNLTLAVRMPAFGKPVKQTIRHGGSGPQRAVRLPFHHEATKWIRRANLIQTGRAQFKLRPGNFNRLRRSRLNSHPTGRLPGPGPCTNPEFLSSSTVAHSAGMAKLDFRPRVGIPDKQLIEGEPASAERWANLPR
jgi:hypothetical protein